MAERETQQESKELTKLQAALVQATEDLAGIETLRTTHRHALGILRGIGMETEGAHTKYTEFATRIVHDLYPISWKVRNSKFFNVRPTLVVHADNEETWRIILHPVNVSDTARIVAKAFLALGMRPIFMTFPGQPNDCFLRVIVFETTVFDPPINGEKKKFIAYLRFNGF